MKKQHLTKWLTATLACTFIAAAATSCAPQATSSMASSGSASSEAKTSSVAEEFDPKTITNGVKLTVCAPENIKVQDYNTNEMTKAAEEALGVDLEFSTLPSADYANKLNVMVTGGDVLPDIIFKPSNVDSWAQDGAIIPLTKYYKDANMSANIRAASERTETDIPLYLTLPDGEIYGLPYFTQSYNGEVWKKLWVYKPWLDQLGVSVPQTTEEYYDVLKKIASTDLNGNGKADEMGLVGSGGIGSWFSVLMSSYIYAYDGEYRVLDNGKISFAYTSDAWKDGLKYIKKLFDEKLISSEILTMNGDQYKAMLNSDDLTVFSFSYYNADQMNADLMDRKLGYTYINALEGPTGLKEAMYAPQLPTAGAVISSDCKNPDAAFLVGDYWCNEEMGITQRWGQRGVDWDYFDEAKIDNKSDYSPTVPGFDISIVAYDDAAFWGSGTTQNRSYLQMGTLIWSRSIVNGVAVYTKAADEAGKKKMQYAQIYAKSSVDGHAMARKEVVDYLPLTVEENDKIKDIKATLSSYIKETTGAFLTGSKDIDKDWDAYLTELDHIGYKTVLETYQASYDRIH